MLAVNIRMSFPTLAFPLVMLTSMGQVKLGTYQKLFKKCISKPVKSSQLFNTLAEALSSTRPQIKQLHQPKAAPDFNIAQQHPLTILLAEDNVVNQKVATKILERMGYRIDVVANGSEAVDSIRRQHYDVILMDIQMPQMDGVTATSIIRGRTLCRISSPTLLRLPPTRLQGDRRESIFQAGMNDYLSKPVRISDLEEKHFCVSQRKKRQAELP